MFKPVLVSTVLAMALAAPAAAQTEELLKDHFEGHRVTVRMDMPGTSDGVDVHAVARRAIDFGKYKDDLKRYGTAIRAGATVVVTLVKVKKDLIEFQLGGGGFGTFGDDTSTSVYLPLLDKSDRERDLEQRIRDEDERDRRRRMERELSTCVIAASARTAASRPSVNVSPSRSASASPRSACAAARGSTSATRIASPTACVPKI